MLIPIDESVERWKIIKLQVPMEQTPSSQATKPSSGELADA